METWRHDRIVSNGVIGGIRSSLFPFPPMFSRIPSDSGTKTRESLKLFSSVQQSRRFKAKCLINLIHSIGFILNISF